MTRKPYIGKWISCLYRIGQSYFDHYFVEYGIGLGHYSCLLCLFRQEGITQEVISKFTNKDKGTITRSIRKLESLGYVEKQIDSDDRRAYKVYLTEKGKAIEPEVRQILKKWAEAVTAGFSPTEAKIAYELIERMALNAIELKESMNIDRK
ncbi:MarR family winged helix-turn-helix transcriptional regulator [Pelosinus sp. sgz500959]|uniref:MarR family winged helix-turn-helix transcriptional regulator n=1 Tax=Pelosinus sp. sgz500959 TaxID=3242472 RepID=UPI00366E3466